MRFAIISKFGDGISMAHTLAKENYAVTLWNSDPHYDTQGTGYDVKRTNEREISMKDFIDKQPADTIFIFDGSEAGAKQDKMRLEGKKVIGSSAFGGKIEDDRFYGIEMQKELKVKTPPTIEVNSIDDAIAHIQKFPKKYILKQSGNLPKTLNWKASRDDSVDLIYHLLTAKKKYEGKLDGKMIMQECIEGVEVAVAGWFNGKDWICTTPNPLLKTGGEHKSSEILLDINFENKQLLEGDRGCTTGETGTVMYFMPGENEIFKKMLKPLTAKLREANHVGNVDANCIVNDEGIFLLECTMRMGYPATDLYIEMLTEPAEGRSETAKELKNPPTPLSDKGGTKTGGKLGRFFEKLANGEKDGYSFDMEKKGIVLVLSFPTYPYETVNNEKESYFDEIVDLSELDEDEMERVHFTQSRMENIKGFGPLPVVSNTFGYFCTVTARDKRLSTANRECVDIIEKIIPAKKGFYRTDLADVVSERIKKLEKFKII